MGRQSFTDSRECRLLGDRPFMKHQPPFQHSSYSTKLGSYFPLQLYMNSLFSPTAISIESFDVVFPRLFASYERPYKWLINDSCTELSSHQQQKRDRVTGLFPSLRIEVFRLRPTNEPQEVKQCTAQIVSAVHSW